MEELSRAEGNQDRAKVICELADLLYGACTVAAILGVPFHSAQWSAHRAHTPGRGRGLLNHAMSDFDDVKFMLPGGESDLEPEMQEEDTGQSSPRINETDLQIVLCGLLIKKKILAFVPQGEDQVDSATFVVTDQGELFMRENPSWRDVSEAYVKRHRQ